MTGPCRHWVGSACCRGQSWVEGAFRWFARRVMLQLAAWLSAVAVWLVCLVLPLLLVCRAMVLCQRKRPVLGWCLSVVCCPSGLLLVWGVATVAGQAWGSSCVVLRGSCSLRCLSRWVVLVPRVCWGVVASSPESVTQSLGAVGWHGGGCPQTSDLRGGGLLEELDPYVPDSVGFLEKQLVPPALATSRCASVTMKNQCVAVRGAHRPWSPIVKTGAVLLGPSAPCRTCLGRPHFGSGPLGRGLTTSCQQPWESCVTVPTLASDRGTSGGRSSYAAAKSPACVSYQSCMS